MSAALCGDQSLAGLVKLDDLIDALESNSETAAFYLDLNTGESCAISEEAFRIADEDIAACDMLPDWQREEVELARLMAASNRYVALPTSWEVHEWAIMQQFGYSITDDQLRGKFLAATKGRGSFRRFKNQLTHHGLWESWYQFKRLSLRERVIEWCQEHGNSFET
jgi:hypothetical protein